MTDPAVRTLPDLAATRALGRRLGAALEPGLVVALLGDLGAGKTSLVKAAIASLGPLHEDDVVSPTFILVAEYDGPPPVLHVDAYRLGSAAELDALGYEVGAPRDRAVLIEWADRVEQALPADRLTVSLEHTDGGRRAQLSASGPVSQRALERVLAGP